MKRVQHWMSNQTTSSIIYVAFGSMARLDGEQLIEIAHALHNYSVIWSLKSHLQTSLPSSFIENSRHLVLNWTPQRFILSHSSIRLFISHGGWNSLLESMSRGKVTLVWPVFADQFMNGDRLEKQLQIGRCIKNLTMENEHRILSRDELGRYLNEIFDRENFYFHKAQQIQEMIRNARQKTSPQSLEEIIQIVNNQQSKRINQHHEL